MSIGWLTWMVVVANARAPSADRTRSDVALALADHLSVAFCVLGVPDAEGPLSVVSASTHPSRRDLLTSVLSFRQVSQFMSGELYLRSGGKTMVVMRLDSSSLEYLSRVRSPPKRGPLPLGCGWGPKVFRLSHNKSLSTATWMVFSESPFRSELFGDIYVPFDCEFIYVRESNDSFSLTEIYQIEKRAAFETYDFGFWTKEGGLVVADAHFYARRNNLKGHTLTAIVNNDPPYVSIEKDGEGKSKFRGYLYEIWNELEFRLNFRTEFPEEFLNRDVSEGLKKEETDFALARISIVSSAFDDMDFSQPIHEAKSYMFGQRPGSELDWDSYLKPFSANTWFVSVFWMFSSSLALAVLYRKAWEFGTSEREADYYVFTFSESVLTVFRAICMQGSDVTPRSNACRFFFLSIYLTALVVTSAFSAALFSLLTIPKPRSPFNSLEEVLTNNKFRIGFPADPDFHKLVEDFSSTLSFSSQIKLLERLMASKENLPETPLRGLEQICTDKSYIFMFDLPDVLYFMQNTSRACRDKILPSGPPLFTEFIGFGFKKKNPYKGLINFHLIRMKNEGILKRLLLNYWPPQIPTVQATWVRVTLSDISPILYMFALGAALGTAFLYGEKALLRLRKRNKRTKEKRSPNPSRLYDDGLLPQRRTPFAAFERRCGTSPDWALYYRINSKN